MNFRLATASVGMGVFFGLVLWLHQRDAAPPEEAYVKPNIIFLSFCSMRSQDLGIYNNLNKNITPNIDENFQHGFIFKNAFTSYGWTNMSSYLFQNFNYSFLSENGYEALGSEPSSLVYWIPKPILLNQKKPMVVEQYTNQIVDGLKNLKDLILTKRQKPFFAFVHIKYMHYPYIDLTNPNSNWDIYLTENEKSYVRDIIYSPKKFPNNILMPLILYGSNKILDSYPQIQSKAASPITRFFDQYQLFSDQALVQKWRKTDNFENDLLLIKKIYRAKLHFLDQQIGDLLNLYGDLRLQENTIIILTGDHGESFLEHDTLGHAAKVNDEIMNFPLLVKFPRSKKKSPLFIEDQVYQGSFKEIVSGLIEGRISENNFQNKFISLNSNRKIIMRNCSDTIRGIRDTNKWKYIKNQTTSEEVLFDLQKDPQELNNVKSQYPEVLAQMELYLTLHNSEISKIYDHSPCNRLTSE